MEINMHSCILFSSVHFGDETGYSDLYIYCLDMDQLGGTGGQ